MCPARRGLALANCSNVLIFLFVSVLYIIKKNIINFHLKTKVNIEGSKFVMKALSSRRQRLS